MAYSSGFNPDCAGAESLNARDFVRASAFLAGAAGAALGVEQGRGYDDPTCPR